MGAGGSQREAELDARHLVSRIASLRSRVRRLLALYGLSWVVGVIVPLLVLAGLADWLIHFDAGVRLLLLLALAGSAGWMVYRRVVLPLVVRFKDLDIAMRIEERWPGLNDRLASTIQFLAVKSDDDDRFGSRSLREATIKQTLEETRAIDFREVVERRPVLRAMGLAAGALAVLVAVVAAEPALSRIAARRLFLPFGADRWPQMTHLTLLDKETPRKVARGEPFSLAVAVAQGDRVPSNAKATYRYDDGETGTESLRSVEGGVFRGRIEAVEKSFRFSVAAGDDQTSVRDIAVKVVPPPAVKEMTVRLVSPEYTRLAPQTLAQGKTQIKAVEGTRVELAVVANKPIESATLRLGDAAAPGAVVYDKTRTRLTTSFTLSASHPFWFELLDTEGFRNREFVKYDARSIRDEAPRVVIDEPTNDRDVPAQATVPVVFSVDDDFGIQSARLIYKAASGGSEPTQEVVLPLWDDQGSGQDGKPVTHHTVRYEWNLEPLNLPPGSIITFHADARDFDALKGPNLGKSRELRLRIVSDDEIAHQLDDARRAIREDIEGILAMQNQARTPVDEALRTLSKTDHVNKPAVDNLKNAEMIQRQVSNRITNKVDGLQEKVDRALADLKNFRLPNADAQKQMDEMSAGVSKIRDQHLEPAEQGLTHASKNLADPQDKTGAQGRDPEKPADSPKSQAGRPENAPQPKASAASKGEQGQPKSATSKNQSGKTSKGDSSKSDSSKGDSSKSDSSKGESSKGDSSKGDSSKGDSSKGESSKGESSKGEQGQPKAEKGESSQPQGGRPNAPKDAAKESLAEAQTNQKAIADELKKMLDGLSEFETYRGVVKDAEKLLKEHEQVMKQTSEASAKPDLTGKTPEQLTPEQKADLANLAARQSNVGRETQSLQEKLGQMSKRLEESDPLASSAMKEAADQLQKQGTAAKVNEAADRLERNQMGAARQGQEQARQDLKDLLDSIQNRRERELARLVKELKNAEAELEKLRQRQTQNLEKTREARKNPDAKERANELKRLAKEQAEIQKQLDNQLKRLAKLNAESAAKSGSRASGKMEQAKQNLEQGQGEQAGEEEEEALADLEEAQERVKQTRKEAEEQLAMEQLSKMSDRLAGMADRQEKVKTDTAGYEKLRADHEGKLTIAQRTGIRQLAGVQEAIKDETADLIEKLEGAPVFALTLKRAATGMDTASQRLQSLKTDETTQRAESSAAARFRQLLDALKPDKGKNAGQQKPQQGDDDQGGGGGGGGGDGIPPAAQLKMLKSLQEEINERTEYFDELKRRGKELSPDQTVELDRLHDDQGTLADLVRDLTKPKTDDAED